MQPEKGLPAVLAGPILRKVTPDSVAIWLAVRASARVKLELQAEAEKAMEFILTPGTEELSCICAGERLHYLLIDVPIDTPLPAETWISYRLSLELEDDPESGWQDHTIWAPDLTYPGVSRPGFMVPQRIKSLLHGSCRKPHSEAGDGLVAADAHLKARLPTSETPGTNEEGWPSLLVMSGDQVYVDDVAGPMVQAIGALAQKLGLHDETLSGLDTGLPDSGHALHAAGGYLYRRDGLLPKIDQNARVFDVLFGGTSKPIFTSLHARNHLFTLAEMLAMYLLVWSPAVWKDMPEFQAPEGLSDKEMKMYAEETETLKAFVADLPAVRRLMAHLPTAMIFDDHDVTDDWNLSLAWEQAAYGHPLARRVIGNAIIAYSLNQGWGNCPQTFRNTQEAFVRDALADPGSDRHDAAITALLALEEWDYQWQTDPPLIVLDTRTRRWRSERNSHYPSGLLDWEAATDLQSHLRGKNSVLLVSAAPIFGVKLIEAVQKFFTVIGKPLMVDAEYWMAHAGTAGAILNVFRHRNTPKHFVILSGDVHYSFVYDVELRQVTPSLNGDEPDSPQIWQICSSGIKNIWPEKLIRVFDFCNRWAFAPRSPLNWFTKRRGMRVIPRKPVGTPHGQRILNASGIGLVELDETGAPTSICQLTADGRKVPFERREKEARLD
ncbi:alkaline phosphatase family protein [uncultured Roseibium sp.]|uniref:alkaline phosphatase family protein n=1 Tax=uncultured Roseibium sp. TaxID=1936171 RepID=UPI0026092F45|nr:alkaline phosphatase family protein [uncultured Roseibium sp.]